MNKVILIGRMTKSAEIRVTNNGKKVANFTVAVDDGKKDGERQSQFINCTAWERTAEILEMYTKKGVRIGVVGRIQNRSWDKPDGTKGYATDVVTTELEILTTKAEAEALPDDDSSAGSQQKSQPNKGGSSPNDKKDSDKKEDDKGDDSGDLPEIDVDKLNVQMPF